MEKNDDCYPKITIIIRFFKPLLVMVYFVKYQSFPQ